MNKSTSSIKIYTTKVCPYCVRAKAILKRNSLPFEEIDVSDSDAAIALAQKSGRKTVPQIYFGDYHVGGCDDLAALEQSGKLPEIVKQYIK